MVGYNLLWFSIIHKSWGLSTGLSIGAYLRAYFAYAYISLNILTYTSKLLIKFLLSIVENLPIAELLKYQNTIKYIQKLRKLKNQVRSKFSNLIK